MKTPRFLVFLLAALFTTLAPRGAEARVEVSFDFFQESLSPYGEWLDVGDYGYGWRPSHVDSEWAPYSDGYWAYTDAGWTWVSYEDFGGIVYHYGRWIFVQDEGWCWIPDYEWAPAWVSWRHSDDYVGWAPLPPEARWQPTIGISVWADRQYDIGPGYYSFCRVRDFGAPVLRPVIINRVENLTIIRNTVNVTNITYNNHYGDGGNQRLIYNGGPDYDSINRRSSRRVPALKLVQNTEVNLPGGRDWDRNRDGRDRGGRRHSFNSRAEGNQLLVTAPVVRPRGEGETTRPEVRRTVATDKVTRGWNGVKNEEVRNELRQEMQRQTRGLTPETAPARTVAAADLKVLPEKADPRAASPVASRERPGRDKGRGPEANPDPGATPRTPQTSTAAAPPEGQPAGRKVEENGRDQTPRGTKQSVAGQAGRTPTPPAPKGPETRRNEAAEAAAANTKRGAEGQRSAGSKSQPQQAAERQNKQTAQETAVRQQAEATARQKQMEEQRDRQRELAAAAERQRMQVEQGRAARQQTESAQRKQMEAQQRGAQEAARQQGARRQAEQQAAEQNQRRQAIESQQRAVQNAARKQAERGESQGRQREQSQPPRGEPSREQQSRGEPSRGQPRQSSPPNTAPSPRGGAVPAESEEGRGGRRGGR